MTVDECPITPVATTSIAFSTPLTTPDLMDLNDDTAQATVGSSSFAHATVTDNHTVSHVHLTATAPPKTFASVLAPPHTPTSGPAGLRSPPSTPATFAIGTPSPHLPSPTPSPTPSQGSAPLPNLPFVPLSPSLGTGDPPPAIPHIHSPLPRQPLGHRPPPPLPPLPCAPIPYPYPRIRRPPRPCLGPRPLLLHPHPPLRTSPTDPHTRPPSTPRPWSEMEDDPNIDGDDDITFLPTPHTHYCRHPQLICHPRYYPNSPLLRPPQA